MCLSERPRLFAQSQLADPSACLRDCLLACLRARSGKTATTCRAYFRLPRCTTAVGVPAEEQGSGSARVGGGTAALGLRLGAMPGCKLKKRFQGFPVAGCRAKFGFLAADLCSKVEGSEAEPENSAPGHGSHHEGPRTETDLCASNPTPNTHAHTLKKIE